MIKSRLQRQARQAWYRADCLAPPTAPPEPRLYLPAMPPLKLIHWLETYWWHYRRRRLFRQWILPLLRHDDELLMDIGQCRDDILWAAGLPLKVDAIHALGMRRQRRETLSSPGRRANAESGESGHCAAAI